ncbi:MAG: hypothetical protein G01um101420_773 [Parcubacteria group bacterium Gr01-1014_20]|nr:MAG: hypothetical protein G01um101420_773 [Parcubacteria group bacterium Gr01-1014_20]
MVIFIVVAIVALTAIAYMLVQRNKRRAEEVWKEKYNREVAVLKNKHICVIIRQKDGKRVDLETQIIAAMLERGAKIHAVLPDIVESLRSGKYNAGSARDLILLGTCWADGWDSVLDFRLTSTYGEVIAAKLCLGEGDESIVAQVLEVVIAGLSQESSWFATTPTTT